MSWFTLVYDLPVHVTDNGNKEWKEWKIHNGTLCKIKGWQLHLEDEERLRSSDEVEVVLRHLPMCVFVEVDLDPPKQYGDLPPNWYPIKPGTKTWELDKEENILIARKGFTMVPHFASTIHLATGRTMESAIPDLKQVDSVPSHASAMKAYIALSRVQSTDGLLIPEPFSPTLFQQGPQPWPTLLKEVMRTEMDDDEIYTRCQRLVDQLKEHRSSKSSI